MFKTKLWRNKYFRFFTIFSLLLHTILYFCFFNVSFQKRSKTMLKELWDSLSLSPAEHQKRIKQREELFKKLQELKRDREKDNGLPAKLTPKKSDFGWVFFEDSPSAAKAGPVQVPTTEEGDVALAPVPHATELVPEKPKQPAAISTTIEPSKTSPALASPQAISQQPSEQRPAPEQQQTQPKVEQQQVVATPQQKPTQTESMSSPPPAKIIKKIAQATKPKSSGKRTIAAPKKIKKRSPKTEKQLKKELKARSAGLIIESLMDELSHDAGDEETQTPITPFEDQADLQAYEEPAAPSADIQARIDRIARRQEQLEQFAPTPTKPGQEVVPETLPGGKGSGEGKVATAKVRGARAMDKKGGRGIIALTKGFVENLKDEGEDLIERDGDPNKRPSFEEMKYISYESNINWCLQAAWKQNFAYNPAVRIREGKAVIEFTLNAKGYVTNSELLQSTGYKELDNIIMKNLKFASPFPPLPKHFGVKTYTTGRIIHVFCNRFGT